MGVSDGVKAEGSYSLFLLLLTCLDVTTLMKNQSWNLFVVECMKIFYLLSSGNIFLWKIRC